MTIDRLEKNICNAYIWQGEVPSIDKECLQIKAFKTSTISETGKNLLETPHKIRYTNDQFNVKEAQHHEDAN